MDGCVTKQAEKRRQRPHALARALADLRRGEMVLISDHECAALILAAEALNEDIYAQAKTMTGSAAILATTRRRAAALDLVTWKAAATAVVELHLSAEFPVALIRGAGRSDHRS